MLVQRAPFSKRTLGVLGVGREQDSLRKNESWWHDGSDPQCAGRSEKGETRLDWSPEKRSHGWPVVPDGVPGLPVSREDSEEHSKLRNRMSQSWKTSSVLA